MRLKRHDASRIEEQSGSPPSFETILTTAEYTKENDLYWGSTRVFANDSEATTSTS